MLNLMATIRQGWKSLEGFPRVLSSDLLFLIYINDINNASSVLNLILFADDINVFMSHKDPDYLSDMLNLEMGRLSIWFKANKLSLNLKKTKVMVFRPRQKRMDCVIQIGIDNQHIV